MRKDFGAKSWTYPQPVFIVAAYDENGVPNAMNAAWGGISDDNQLYLCLSKGHKTVKNILLTGELTVSMATKDYVKECDYLGIESGNKTPDKLSRCGLTTVRSSHVNAPVICELPMCLDCRLISYDGATGMMLCEIVNVSCDESALTDGKIDPAKLCPIVFDPVNARYLTPGETVGNAFKAGFKLK